MNDVPPKYLDGFLAAVGAKGNAGKAPSAVAQTAPEKQPPVTAPATVRTALSFEERVKRETHPLDAFPRLLSCARTNQPPGVDDQFRFQWFGLFYQGPRQDAFVLRLRLPGARLRDFQLDGLAEITQELAAGYLLCNAQGGVDIPGVPVRAAAEILRRVEEIGLRSFLTGGDCVRAVRGGEREVQTDSPVPPMIYPLVCELEQALAMNRRLSDLPGPCEVALRGRDDSLISPEKNTLSPETLIFRTVSGLEPCSTSREQAVFSLVIPGGGAPDLAFTANQVVPACLELLTQWAERGDRSDRQRTGLADFCASVGHERLRALITGRVGSLPSAPIVMHIKPGAPQTLPGEVRVPDGRLLSGGLTRLAAAAREEGSVEVRLLAGHISFPQALDKNAAEQALREVLDCS